MPHSPATLVRYRVFVQDVGQSGYSGFTDVQARSPLDAVLQVSNPSGTWAGKNLIALPRDRKDLWPHPKTGVVSPEALKVGRSRDAA